MDTLNKLIQLFGSFPGIGPRQARRFVFFLLTKDERFRKDLIEQIQELNSHVRACERCFRFFTHSGSAGSLCPICRSSNRNRKSLMIVEKDTDLENIERGKIYSGLYFVLGGTLSPLERKIREKVRMKELVARVRESIQAKELSEIIVALSATPDGEHTEREIRRILAPIANENSIRITTLGRGLSTGSELEYSDPETIKNALRNRHEQGEQG